MFLLISAPILISAPKWKHDFFRHLFNILAVLLGVLRALRTIYHLEGLLGYYRGKTFRSLLFCFGELLIDNKASFLGQALFMKEVNLISKNKYMYACLKFLSIYWFYFWGKYSLIQDIVFLYTCFIHSFQPFQEMVLSCWESSPMVHYSLFPTNSTKR